jgi:hypothetical protein
MPLVYAKRWKFPEILQPNSSGRSTSQPIVGLSAVLLAGTLLAWPAGACAQSAAAPGPSERLAANGQVPAGDNAAVTTNSVVVAALAEALEQTAPPSRKGETRLAADRDDDEDENEPATRKPASEGARSPAQTAQPPGKVETRPGADRDEDEDEDDAATKKPVGAPKGARSPAQTAQPPRKADTRPAADRDEDEDEDDAVTRKPAGTPRGGKSPAQATQPAASKPAASPARPPRQVGTKPATDGDDEAPASEDAAAPTFSVDSAASDMPASSPDVRDPCRSEIKPPVTFSSQSNTTRTIVLGALGATPGAANLLSVTGPVGMVLKAGGPVAAIIGFFWKETDNSKAVFEAMKKYVDDLVPEMIDRARVEDLENEVHGLRDEMDLYAQLTSPLAKGIKISTILSLTQVMENKFFNFKHPEKLLTQFVTFGTLKLTARREQYLYAEEYYGPKGRDDRKIYLQKLEEDVKKYSQGAAAMRDQALAWRLSKISWYKWWDGPANNRRFSVKDEMCGYDQAAPSLNYGRNRFGMQETAKELLERGEADINRRTAERIEQVRKGFLSQLYPVWETATYWEDFGKVPAPSEIKSPEPGQSEPARPGPTAGGIVPCAASSDPKVQDVRTEEGKRCRRDNIDRYLAALDVTGSYKSDEMKACLKDLRKLTETVASRGSYYDKLDECAEKAKAQSLNFSVDSATAGDTGTDERPAGDCDVACVRKLIRAFAQTTPEPGRVEAAHATDEDGSDQGEDKPGPKMKDEPSEATEDK